MLIIFGYGYLNVSFWGPAPRVYDIICLMHVTNVLFTLIVKDTCLINSTAAGSAADMGRPERYVPSASAEAKR